MLKIQNIFLLIFLMTILDPIHARGGSGGHSGSQPSLGPSVRRQYSNRRRIGFVDDNRPVEITQDQALSKQFMNAVFDGNIDQIKTLILSGVNINPKESGPIGHTPLTLAIERAGYSLDQGFSDAEIRLSIVELLIQAGALVNVEGEVGRTPLERALTSNLPKLPIIKLLLGYGANITENALKMTELKSNKKEIMQIFDIYKRLLKQVQSNPTGELLRVTIRFNKPYFVQLIVDNKPALVTLSDIELAEETSPASVSILSKAFKLTKFKELATKKNVPVELTQYIEKLAKHNK